MTFFTSNLSPDKIFLTPLSSAAELWYNTHIKPQDSV